MEAMFLQTRDVVAAAFDPNVIDRRVEQLAAAVGAKLPTDKVETVMERVQERFTFNETERKSVMAHLIEGGNLSQYGLHAAITRAAQDADDYDRATEMEYMGGKVVELARTDWETLVA
jgi:ketopantoate reductase